MRKLFTTPFAAVFVLGLALLSGGNVCIAGEQREALAESPQLESVVLGGGCFWGAEKMYAEIPGVDDAVTGFAGGKTIDTTLYAEDEVSNALLSHNHAEVVEVTFDTHQISYGDIIKTFFESHDPTQLNRQGADSGPGYRSIILVRNDTQRKTAADLMAEYQVKLTEAGYGAIVTEIQDLDKFYRAEEKHQNYIAKNPEGYCPDHRTGVVFDDSPATMPRTDNKALMAGKQILVIESRDFCPHCERFKKEVASGYKGHIKMTYRLPFQLDGLEIRTPTWATPTVVFLQDGKEVFSRRGFMPAEEFYEELGRFEKQ